jgi:hypothetical protein
VITNPSKEGGLDPLGAVESWRTEALWNHKRKKCGVLTKIISVTKYIPDIRGTKTKRVLLNASTKGFLMISNDAGNAVFQYVTM